MKRLKYRDAEGKPQWTPELLEDDTGAAGAIVREKIAAIEDILGDDYDIDRLRKLVHADREDTNCTPAELPEEIGQKLISKR